MPAHATIACLLLAACQPTSGPAFRYGSTASGDTDGPPTVDSDSGSAVPHDSEADTDTDADADTDTDVEYHGPAYACVRSVHPDFGADREPRGFGSGQGELRQAHATADHNPASDTEPPHECRLWAMTTPDIPAAALQAHLVDLPDSIKNLGSSNDDGWGLAWWDGDENEPTVHRGQPPADEDASFDEAVAQAMAAQPRVAVAHVRACSSGLCDLPNPHPFRLDLLDRTWLLGHNGTIDKELLIELIDKDFLVAHPPVNGENTDEWIDSELYLRLIMQHVEAHRGFVVPGIQSAIQALHGGDGRVYGANFFLTDGQTIWGYRDGMSLYWFHDTVVAPCSAIASSYPTDERGRWQSLADGQLVVMHPDREPELVQIWLEDAPEDESPEF